jgi:large subunit ribosomal protein L15
MKIHDARPKEKRKSRKRVGRGHASGSGRTAGRGEKGAKSRSGWSSKPGFEGGSLPLVRRLPKRGFSNHPFRTAWAEVNLDQLSRFEAGSTVDEAALRAAGVIKGTYDKIVVMGRGDIEVALTVQVHRFTRSAAEKIAAAGGTAQILGADAEASAAVAEPAAAAAESVAVAADVADDDPAEPEVAADDEAESVDDEAEASE